MAEIGGFYKPQLEVAVNGRPLRYDALHFDAFGPWNLLELVLRAKPTASVGDTLTGVFSWQEDSRADFFTCAIDAISPAGNGAFLVRALSPYQHRMGATLAAGSWRSATAKEVLLDLLDTAGIADHDLAALPAVTIDRFSTPAGMTVGAALEHLLASAADSAGRRAVVLPAPSGKLTVGYRSDIRISIGTEKIALRRGVNILSRDRNHIVSFALPVLSNQVVDVDGEDRLCTHSRITCRPGHYRLGIEVEPL